MTTIKNFEDLNAWQKARELAGYVYALTRKQKFSRDFGLCNRIQEELKKAYDLAVEAKKLIKGMISYLNKS